MASIYKRGNVYWIKYYIGQRRKEVSLRTDSYQVAREKQRQLESQVAQGSDNPLPTRTPIAHAVTAYRDRSLPSPWLFTTNYDLFNETAMDRLGILYTNGFSGTVERRFNPATFRYALAERLDATVHRYSTVENYVHLCKLHGSINWIEDGRGLFPIREISPSDVDPKSHRVMIYPTPAKQVASFGSPYCSDRTHG